MDNGPVIGNWWQAFLRYTGSGAGEWVGALAVVFGAYIIRLILFFIADNYMVKLASRTKTKSDDRLLKGIKVPFGNLIILWGLYWAVYLLRLPREPYDWHHLVYNIIDTLVILTVLWLAFRVIDVLISAFSESYSIKGEVRYNQLLPFFRDLAKIIALAGAIVFVIIAWGKDPTVMLAGLGIGGLAIGFAAKDTIANIFGSVTIFADRPFDVGDWVVIGNDEGIVEEIGFRTTKVRTFEKTLITIPNSVIANTAVNNFSKRPGRRVKQRIGILYETPIEKIEAVVNGIRRILGENQQVDNESIVVNFEDFADSSLTIFVYYFTSTSVWADYLQVRQDVNFKIMRLFESMGVEFAYPTRTLWHRGDLGLSGMPRLGDGDIDSGN